MSKKLEQKQRRRLADQMKRDQQRKAARRSNIITVAIAVVIIGAVAVFVIFERESSDAPPFPAGVSVAEASCDDIQEHEEEGSEHVEAGTTVDYETSPPTSGNHWPTENLSASGFFPSEVPNESLVHNMEHGQIVIWYSPDAPQNTIDNLETFADAANDGDSPGSGGEPIIVVPFADVPEGKTYVMTGWTKSQACGGYSLAAINDFRIEVQGQGPEQVTQVFTEGDAEAVEG
jgi:Protein of unknown function (DUF3105)